MDSLIKSPPWKPASGGLYKVYYSNGFIFNTSPIAYKGWTIFYSNMMDKCEVIKLNEIFLYIGGPGGKQTVPEHYTAYKVLWGVRLGWLIYPESYRTFNLTVIEPKLI